jgi:hypothetical protein
LATSVGDHFVQIHVELSAAARHPDVQGKHVVMFASQDFITGLNNEFVALIIEPFAIVIGDGGGFLQRGVGRYDFAGDQVFPDAKNALTSAGSGTPEFGGGNLNDAEAVRLFPHLRHDECSFTSA